MPRTRTADARRDGTTSQGRHDVVAVSGRHLPLTRAVVVRAAETVLRQERRLAVLSVTFVGRDRMASLNARWKGHRRPTDVLAFSLPNPGGAVAGDIYVCPWYAAREARARRIPLRQELLRLVIHGVLHVLGHQHPEGEDRIGSPMWRRQERYLEALA